MARVHLIWAQARGGVIGMDGRMPWHLPQDLANFKRLTLGCPVIMGRKTWDSLPAQYRPLPGRMNIVVTRQPGWHADGATTATGLDDALQQFGSDETVWVIGGAQMFAQTLPLASMAVVTVIDADFAGDTFAPKLGASWREVARESHTSPIGIAFAWVTYHQMP